MNALGVHARFYWAVLPHRDYAEGDLAGMYKGPLLYCRDAFDGLHIMDSSPMAD